MGVFSQVSIMYDHVFHDQPSFHPPVKMLYLYDSFACNHSHLYRCIQETLWIIASWLYCVLCLLPALSFVNCELLTTLRSCQVNHESFITLFVLEKNITVSSSECLNIDNETLTSSSGHDWSKNC